MDQPRETDETIRLLSELDSAIDRSSLIRDILNCRERLHDLEQLTGPSLKTNSLRRQIRILETRLADHGDSGCLISAYRRAGI